jgi:hypothetical protein
MKLFRIEAKNDRRWTSSGTLSREFYVLADDVMSALVIADGVVQRIKERISEAGRETDLSSFVIRTISEQGPVVGNAVDKYDDALETWVTSIVEAVKAGD